MQHINLFLPRFHRHKVLLSMRVALLVWAATMVGMVGLNGTLWYRNRLMEKELQDLARKETAICKQLETLTKTMAPKEPNPLLQQEVARLEKKLQARLGLVNTLRGDIGSTERSSPQFSAYLEALARQYVPGMWLTQIRILTQDQTIDIRGQALEGKLVPAYLQRLKGELIFKGAEFNTLHLGRASGREERLDFVLSSMEAPKPEETGLMTNLTQGTAATPPSAKSAKAADFINQQLPGAKLIQKMHGGMDIPTLENRRR